MGKARHSAKWRRWSDGREKDGRQHGGEGGRRGEEEEEEEEEEA